ncbi:hypothetical protein DPMN_152713 [Dreissena polymorpha]|uniref:Uncharacterized protein n=1 Tax=Dreissena polymorpha TaxID=45954 RepID=A0A9D4FMD3_DREPO|nr:hypothetical protein DPMN_152713 [Dreissena polymorpha]
MCNMRGCGSDFYGDPRSVLKCYGCGDIAVGDKCPDIAQCDKTLEVRALFTLSVREPDFEGLCKQFGSR